MNKQVFWSIVVAVVLTVAVVAAAVTLRFSGGGEDATTDPFLGRQGVAGASSAPGQDSDAVIDRPDCPAGTVAGIDLDCLGGQVSAERGAADSGVTIVNVWAWWCQPCRAELPLLAQVAETHPAWDVVGVHADTNAANGAALLEELGVDLPSFQDSDNSFASAVGVPRVIPITLVLQDAHEVGRFIRAFESTADIESAVEGALHG